MSKRWVELRTLAALLWLASASPLLAAIPDRVALEPALSRETSGPIKAEVVASFGIWREPINVPTPQPSHAEPFGYETSRRLNGGLQDKWQQVKNRLPAERRTLAACRADMTKCPKAARALIALIDNAMKRDRALRVADINRAINLSIRFAEDRDNYGVEEYWATPLTTFARGAGDCEDYAIAKLVALQEMEFDDADLRIVIVRDENGQGHAMTAVRQDTRWLILDNRQLGLAGDEVSERSTPLFVIDAEGAKRMSTPLAKAPPQQAAPDTAARAALLIWPATTRAPFSSSMPG
ncbi:MAG TPA: transglutaminase-like cysteine peptidase [Pseudolabrys sp.]|nr:transglutaminase-like cysteine peptidase [Pseudolabrys sp.]